MKIKFVATILLLSASTFGLGMQRANLDETTIAKLKPIQKQGPFGQEKVNIDALQKPGRKFVGKMDSFGLIRYFLIKNNQHAEDLVKGARNGGGWDPEFFYFDEPAIAIEKIDPNIIVIHDIE